jgi:gliding motility-associated-like protein
VGAFTYSWSNANQSTGPDVCALTAGPLTVTAQDANGCQGTGSLTITEPQALTVAISNSDVKCKGSSNGSATATPNGGTGPYQFQWSGGSTPNQAIALGLSAGVYSLTLTDSKSCQAYGSVTIGEPATGVSVSAAQTVTSCFGENLSEATATATGGAAPYTFYWTPSNKTGQTAINLMPGTYTVVATDAGGCTASGTVNISQWDPIYISISFVPPVCHGSADGEMAANIVTGGNGSYSFKWNNGATNDFVNGLQGGLTYTVTVTDTQGCTGSLSRFLNDPPAMQLSFANTNSLCYDSQDGTATVANLLNASMPFSYQWDQAALRQKTATADSLAAGTYTVTVTDAKGCTGTGITEIEEPAPLNTTFEVTNNQCFGEEKGIINMTVSGGVPGYGISWSNGQNSNRIANLPAGNYYVTITDANACQLLDTTFVQAPQGIRIEILTKDVSCFSERDGAITIKATGGTPPFTYSTDGAKYYGSSTLIALKAGEYPVYIKDAKNCIQTTQATVNEPPELSVDILVWGLSLDEHTINYGDSIPVTAEVTNAQGRVTYNWNAAWCGSLSFNGVTDCEDDPAIASLWSSPAYSNDYFVEVKDEKGCFAKDHLQVHVRKQYRVVVPTGFTPNGDDRNNLLSVHGKSGTVIKLFQVFDRWGELMFQDIDLPINDTTRGWDGTFKSKNMPPGVYVWYLEAEYEDGTKDSYKGETTLIR